MEDEIVDDDVIDIFLINLFSNAVENLEIPEFNGTITLADNISHPILKAILKYNNHSSNVAIKRT